MAFSVVARKSLYVLASAALCVGVMGVQPVGAQQNIQAIVCGDGALLEIEKPISDTVVTSPDVVLSGSVGQANQLEVYIDNQLDSIVPLQTGATTFEATVRLAPGTRTIKLEAIDACQTKNATASIITTYQPAVAASAGSATPTQIGGGVVIGGTPPPAAPPAQSPIQRIFTEPLHDIAHALDLAPPVNTQPQAGMPQPARLLLVASGAAIVTFSSALLGIDWIERLVRLVALRLGLHRGHAPRLILVTVGLLAVAIAFLL